MVFLFWTTARFEDLKATACELIKVLLFGSAIPMAFAVVSKCGLEIGHYFFLSLHPNAVAITIKRNDAQYALKTEWLQLVNVNPIFKRGK